MICWRPIRLDVAALPAFAAPFDLATVKAHCAIDTTDFDAQLDVYMKAAVHWAEGVMHRSIFSRSHTWVLDRFPLAHIPLPRGKTSAVATVEYSYGGVITTLKGPTSAPPGTDFQEDLRGDDGGVIMPPRTGSWSSTDEDVPSPVVITFTAGYAAANIPPEIVHAMLFAVEDMFDIRGSKDVPAVALTFGGPRLGIRNELLSPWNLTRWY